MALASSSFSASMRMARDCTTVGDPLAVNATITYPIDVVPDWDRIVGDARKPASIRFENLSEVDGLTNDTIYGVQFDASGWPLMKKRGGARTFGLLGLVDPNPGKLWNWKANINQGKRDLARLRKAAAAYRTL